jgi:hypothetical protein
MTHLVDEQDLPVSEMAAQGISIFGSYDHQRRRDGGCSISLSELSHSCCSKVWNALGAYRSRHR